MNIDVLNQLKTKSLENHIPIIMDDTLSVIEDYLSQYKPKKILEIGTAVGYSASQFARILDENVHIDTIELDEQRANEAKINVKNS